MTTDLSRRDFLKAAGAVAAWTCVPKMLHGAVQGPASAKNSAAVLVDLTRCIGCRSCTRACRRQNHLQEDSLLDVPGLDTPMKTTWNEYTVVNAIGGRNIKQQCMHCLDPACASACPVAALYKHELGPVLYRPERCIGCRYCMVACPFDVPKFEWNSGLTPVIGKCHFCASERLFRGSPTACVEACPTGALKFGTRSALLAEAHERIHAHPEKYIDRVYGENEAGGTSWLYLSDVSFESLGFKKNLPSSPMPSFTWEVISRLPSIVGALALLFGLVAKSLSKTHQEEEIA
jgi:Fe-S-cluster-containing dehydrogenase component